MSQSRERITNSTNIRIIILRFIRIFVIFVIHPPLKVTLSLKKLLFGIERPQEYTCAKAGDVENVLDCFVVAGNKKIKTGNDLLFLGYSPLVFGWVTDDAPGKNIEIHFQNNAQTIAKIGLELLNEFPAGEKKLFIFRGISSSQHFETAFHQLMFRWYDRFRKKHASNINLDPGLYNQLKIAYSIPREIKLITLGNENAWNVFPTDLHGPAGNDHYIISLRHDKKACRQAEETGKLALWTVNAENAKDVYALGKNHSKDLSADRTHFTLHESHLYHFPEPKGALSGCELELEKVIGDYGIHRLLLFKITSGQKNENPQRLVHVHRTFLQWHLKQGYSFPEIPH